MTKKESSTLAEGTFGIVFNDDRTAVLLVKLRDLPVWVLPGGGIDAGETPEQGVIREVQEESGYSVEIVRKIGRYSPKNRLATHGYTFELRILSGKPTASSETSAVRFFDLKALPKDLPPLFPGLIADAMQNAEKIIERPFPGSSYSELLCYILLRPHLLYFALKKLIRRLR